MSIITPGSSSSSEEANFRAALQTIKNFNNSAKDSGSTSERTKQVAHPLLSDVDKAIATIDRNLVASRVHTDSYPVVERILNRTFSNIKNLEVKTNEEHITKDRSLRGVELCRSHLQERIDIEMADYSSSSESPSPTPSSPSPLSPPLSPMSISSSSSPITPSRTIPRPLNTSFVELKNALQLQGELIPEKFLKSMTKNLANLDEEITRQKEPFNNFTPEIKNRLEATKSEIKAAAAILRENRQYLATRENYQHQLSYDDEVTTPPFLDAANKSLNAIASLDKTIDIYIQMQRKS